MAYNLLEIATNPQLLTFNLITPRNENIVFRPLASDDNHSLAEFLTGLSSETRQFYTFESYDLNMANELCNAIAKYDKLRFVVKTTTGKIIGLFEYSFEITQDDLDRFLGYGIGLNQDTDCRLGPCLADEYQGQGLASLIFPYLIKIANHFDQKRIILWGGVFTNNAKAIRYYQKCGFKLAGNFVNNNNIPCVDMILDIG